MREINKGDKKKEVRKKGRINEERIINKGKRVD